MKTTIVRNEMKYKLRRFLVALLMLISILVFLGTFSIMLMHGLYAITLEWYEIYAVLFLNLTSIFLISMIYYLMTFKQFVKSLFFMNIK